VSVRIGKIFGVDSHFVESSILSVGWWEGLVASCCATNTLVRRGTRDAIRVACGTTRDVSLRVARALGAERGDRTARGLQPRAARPTNRRNEEE
jgi:hypothetical protein